jgi:hypothetical protein
LVQKEFKVGDATVKVQYGSPAKKGRLIYGDLVPYGKVWRTGANEATVFETDKDLTVNGSVLPAGKYSLFTIPGEEQWVIIFNAQWDQWGAYKYKESKDVLRIEVEPMIVPVEYELFEVKYETSRLILAWDNVEVAVPMSQP